MKLSKGALVVGLSITAVYLFALIYVMANNNFEVVEFQATDSQPANVRIYASPHMKWSEASGWGKALGILCFAGMWAAIWYVNNDKQVPKNRSLKTPQIVGTAIIGLSLLLSIIFTFGSYSASLDQGSVVMEKAKYDLIKDNKQNVKNLFK